jgi:hypothetical protein
MTNKRTTVLLLLLLVSSSIAFGQHALQLDDGAGNYSTIIGSNLGGTYTLPAGGGTLIVVPPPGTPALAWLTGGNGSTTAGTHFLGTTDFVDFDIRVASVRAMRYMPTAFSANLIGGEATNTITSGGYGNIIAGGGASTYPNIINSFGSYHTISGGGANIIITSANTGTIGGGGYNRISGTANRATVAGGAGNTASGNGAFVGGGEDGTAVGANNTASGAQSVVVGGRANVASGEGAFIGGGGWDGTFTSGNTASAEASVVVGGRSNRVTDAYSVVGGGFNNLAGNNIGSTGDGAYAFVGGGQNNSAGYGSTIGGGFSNSNDNVDAIGGGIGNTIVASTGGYCAIAGGANNTISNGFSAIGGGSDNSVGSPWGTIAGGKNNTIGLFFYSYGTIGGGFGNTVEEDYAMVGGGIDNISKGIASTVSGGHTNYALGDYSAVAGGRGLTLNFSADGSFGFLGANTGSNDMSISAANTAVLGNVNMWLANNTNAASELRFYEANATASGAFPPASINYTAFKAGSQSADITYTLPTANVNAAANATDLGSGYLEVTNTGAMSWRQAIVTTGNVTFVNTAAQNSNDQTITVTGAVSGDVVSLGVPNGAVLTNSAYTAWVSANNTVTIRFNNYSGAAQNPSGPHTFKVQVIK